MQTMVTLNTLYFMSVVVCVPIQKKHVTRKCVTRE